MPPEAPCQAKSMIRRLLFQISSWKVPQLRVDDVDRELVKTIRQFMGC